MYWYFYLNIYLLNSYTLLEGTMKNASMKKLIKIIRKELSKIKNKNDY